MLHFRDQIFRESLLIKGRDLITEKDITSIEFFAFANSKFPLDADFLYSQGVSFHIHNNISDAIICYEKSLSISPTVLACENLAVAQSTMGSHDKALQSIILAISIEPERVSSHIKLAELFILLDKIDSATYSLETALALDPYNIQASNILKTLKK